jgi:hypothetical protein
VTQKGVNGSGGLSWPHILWGAGMMSALLGQWYRMETRMAQLEAALGLQPSPVAIESRLIRLETEVRTLIDQIQDDRRSIRR